MEAWERYEIRVRRLGAENDFEWLAEIPELRGCRAYGNTKEEALAELAQVASAYVQIAEEDGETLPLPLVDVPKEYSGRFVVRVSPSLHQSLVLRARREHVSLNKLCSEILAEGIGIRRRTEG